MTTGDEPQLGGQPRANAQADNAPMISGRSTRIIVSARGAYQAGNFVRLVETLPTREQVMLKVTLIRQVLDLMRADIERIYVHLPQVLDALHSLERWLDEPEALRLLQPFADEDSLRDLQQIEPISTSLLQLGTAASRPFTSNIAHYLARAIRLWAGFSAVQEQALLSGVSEWALESAWSMVRAAPLPPLRWDGDYVDTLLADSDRWYLERSVPLLAHLLNDDQHDRLRRVMLDQSLVFIDTLPIASWPEPLQAVIAEIRRSPDEPFDLMDRRYVKAWRGRSFGAAKAAVASLAYLTQHRDGYSFQNVPAINEAERVYTQVIGMWHGQTDPSNAKVYSRLRDWQLDVIYALLHDYPIPPFGDVYGLR